MLNLSAENHLDWSLRCGGLDWYDRAFITYDWTISYKEWMDVSPEA